MSVNNILSTEIAAPQIPEQRFFAQEFDIPKDVAKIVFSNLPDNALAKARKVSRWWNTVINESPQLKNRLIVRTCINAANEAVRTIRHIDDRNSLYRDIDFLRLLIGSQEEIN